MEIVWLVGGVARAEERARSNEMKKWSDTWRGVTTRLVVQQPLVNMRSSWLPSSWVGGERVRERSKEVRSESVGSSLFLGMLKSPRRVSGELALGIRDTSVSSSSRKSSRGFSGGRYTTTMVSLIGWVTEMAWNSNEVGENCGKRMGDDSHLEEISRPVPPPVRL